MKSAHDLSQPVGDVGILPVVVQVNKRGEYGRIRPCEYRGGDGGPAYATMEDRP